MKAIRFSTAGVALLVLGSPVFAQFGSVTGVPPGIPQQMDQAIKDKGYRRVAVLPRFILRDDKGGESLQGQNAALGAMFAEKIEEELLRLSGDRYQVVSGMLVRRALGDATLDDLHDLARLRTLAAKVDGLDALLVGTVKDDRIPYGDSSLQGLGVRGELIEIGSAATGKIAETKMTISLGTDAYRGRSFELRRWMGGELVNLRLNDLEHDPFKDGDFNPAVGVPPQDVHSGPHPLADSSCPFRLAIHVDGQARDLTWLKGDGWQKEPYVTLRPGERYVIHLENRTDRNACMAVFVDGINLLGKKRETPGNCRYWLLEANGTSNLRGWYSGAEGKYEVEEFFAAQPADAVAVQQGFGDALGQITALFYTVGVPPPSARRPANARLPQPFRGPSTAQRWEWRYDEKTKRWKRVPICGAPTGPGPGGTIGTGAGQRTKVQLEEFRGDQPGLILAAITLRYVTESRLKELQAKER